MNNEYENNLIFINVNIITLNSKSPKANILGIKNNKINYISDQYSKKTLNRLKSNNTKIIDCNGATILPGFIDSHCHILSYISSLSNLNLNDLKISSIKNIKQELIKYSKKISPGDWIKANGYHEFNLIDNRHINKSDIDKILPANPVRIKHASGHADILNSLALKSIGIDNNYIEPIGSYIERDDRGEPTGLLINMNSILNNKIPKSDQQQLKKNAERADKDFLSKGITSMQDATYTNSIKRWELFNKLKTDNIIKSRITFMPGYEFLQKFIDAEIKFQSGNNDLNIGPCKIMCNLTDDGLHPSYEILKKIVNFANKNKFPVSIHAIESDVVEKVIQILYEQKQINNNLGLNLRNRIEHCSEINIEQIIKLKESGALISTQPGFIYTNGARYKSLININKQSFLYPIRSIMNYKIPIAASSDFPISDFNPLIGIYSLITRKDSQNNILNKSESISINEAIKLYTYYGAYICSQESIKGSIEIGKLADLIMMNNNPLDMEYENIKELKNLMTVINGKIVWES